MSYFDERPRVREQVRQLQNPVDRLWWLAQLERGIEVADIDREPRFGSRAVLSHLAEVYEEQGQRENRRSERTLNRAGAIREVYYDER